MGRIPGIAVLVFLLSAGYLLVNCQTSDPCESSPCENSDACVGHGTTNYTCTCRDGYYGKNCEKWVCTTLYTKLNNFNLCGVFTSAGVCTGKIANGELCRCPDTHWGPLCNLPTLGQNKTLTLCQRQMQLYSTTVRLINESDFRDNSISLLRTLTDISQLKSVLHEMNLSYLHLRTCTSDGSFATSQCDVSIDDLATWKCYCAHTQTGEALCKVTIGSRAPSNRSCECGCEYCQGIKWKSINIKVGNSAKFKLFDLSLKT
ncbi:delta-like protein B isoform X1 [Haliotis asinina]|uniref:delta-like protein B isoform X1 n=1 Tax=Haliotis asinina TaxID=109174 RepID=UPI0035318990